MYRGMPVLLARFIQHDVCRHVCISCSILYVCRHVCISCFVLYVLPPLLCVTCMKTCMLVLLQTLLMTFSSYIIGLYKDIHRAYIVHTNTASIFVPACSNSKCVRVGGWVGVVWVWVWVVCACVRTCIAGIAGISSAGCQACSLIACVCIFFSSP
jgi:hypothetical protein